MNNEKTIAELQDFIDCAGSDIEYGDIPVYSIKVAITELNKLDTVREKLKHDIENITNKIKENKYDDILKTRLKAFRTKSKELLKILGE